MKPDLYTKVVLTVIAACLVVLVFKDFDVPKSAHAAYGSGNVVDVRIVGIKKDTSPYSSGDWENLPINGSVNVYGSVDIDNRRSIPVTISETVPVKVANTIPVEVQNHALPIDIVNTQLVLPVHVTNIQETKTKKAK